MEPDDALENQMTRLLTVAEVSDYLQLNPRTVLRMAQSGEIPAAKIARQWRFRPELLESWLESQSAVASGATIEPEPPSGEIEIAQAVYTHAKLLELLAGNRLSALREIVMLLVAERKIPNVNPFLAMLYEREAMLSTGIGNGVAIPHPRHAARGLFPQPMVVVARSPGGIDWRAVDGQPVHFVFLLASPSDSTHLRLLARLSRLLSTPQFLPRLQQADTPEAIATAVYDVERTLSTGGALPE